MGELYWLTDAQIERLRPFFPKPRGKPRVDDRRVLSGIVFIQRNGLMWNHAPAAYGPAKTLDNRWKRLSRMGVFATIMTELAAEAQETGIVMINATYRERLIERRPAWPPKRGAWSSDRSNQRRHEHETARHLRQPGAPARPVRHRRSGQ